MEATGCAPTPEASEVSHGGDDEAAGEVTGVRSSGELGFADLGIPIGVGGGLECEVICAEGFLGKLPLSVSSRLIFAVLCISRGGEVQR